MNMMWNLLNLADLDELDQMRMEESDSAKKALCTKPGGKADVFSILSVCMFVCVCVCVYIALVIKHAKRVRRIVFSVWLHHIFPDYLINGMISEKKFYWK